MDDQGTTGTSGGVRFRKLRIVWSVLCVLFCQVLILQWIFSYSSDDRWAVPLGDSGGIMFGTCQGRILAKPNVNISEWSSHSTEFDPTYWNENTPRWCFGENELYAIPCWSPVLLAGAFAVAPWIRWSKRFGLRTILILTTFVAAVLGLIVYSLGK